MKEYVIKTPSKFLCALGIFAVKLKKLKKFPKRRIEFLFSLC
ncbi:hypothetical protein E4N77_11855 [Treponema denticola]|nr:hypothetical protein E4N77_11855 [Treponema denticola]